MKERGRRASRHRQRMGNIEEKEVVPVDRKGDLARKGRREVREGKGEKIMKRKRVSDQEKLIERENEKGAYPC